ncbi:MAG: hypothetical protein RLZZ293_472 [Pseudomonadota bacterium]|jgi:hypothetical protein
MFTSRLNNWFTHYDPYWYSRFIALKFAYIAIILFSANLWLSPPMATITMLFTGGGILIIEIPAINDCDKKDNVYLLFLVLVCLTVGLFASYVYLIGWFILVAGGWCYCLYYMLRRKPELFPLVGVILLFGIISLEGRNTGNFFDIVNRIIFLLEFGLITFWAHKLYPKQLYYKIWQSISLRSVEALIQLINQPNQQQALNVNKHNLALMRSLPLLKSRKYFSLINQFSQQLTNHYFILYQLTQQTGFQQSERDLISMALTNLQQAIKYSTVISQQNLSSSNLSEVNLQLIDQLFISWNQLCVHVNN